MSAKCRLCCKSLFASLVTKFPSCRRDFRINIWGIPSPGDELTGNFGNELEAISISDCGLFRLLARILSHGILGLLQQNLPIADIALRSSVLPLAGQRRARATNTTLSISPPGCRVRTGTAASPPSSSLTSRRPSARHPISSPAPAWGSSYETS